MFGGIRVFACCEEFVRIWAIRDRDKSIIPCILEEVLLELRKGHSTEWGVTTREIRKRLDMRMVSDFVVAFLPIGHLMYTASPLADAGLYLIVARNSRQSPLKDGKSLVSIITSVRTRAIALIGIGVKCS